MLTNLKVMCEKLVDLTVPIHKFAPVRSITFQVYADAVNCMTFPNSFDVNPNVINTVPK